MELGTACAGPGELDRGFLGVTDLPTGASERLPVVIANGERDGPTLWVTAAVHGDEVTGMAAAQDAMTDSLPVALRGAVVCLPCLNPAGLRRTTRTSYYHGHDPNRYFPDVDRDASRPPRVQELVNERVYEAFADRADALLDLHTAQPRSMPFVIRDRVLYGEQRAEAEARALAADLASLVDALGLPVVNEYAAEEYLEQNLQRSTAGAALNTAGIPACTLELGGPDVVEERNRARGVAAIYRAMVELDMLDAVPERARADPVEAPVSYPVKRYVGPRVDRAGIVRHRVRAGDVLRSGDTVADVVSPAGERLDAVDVEFDGYVLARHSGVAAYENDPVASLAVRDADDLIVERNA